ncbi:IclR family transcriptional regulator [Rhodococcus sp. NPDC057135]|uniref:IclR family transcriptional regulator n=1 Tax=Rhodococcus sp. NPDC057135 TaxID=3346028 RepID=UPI00363F267D
MATQAVATALHILEAVARLQPIGLSELARATSVSKATVQRCLTTLRDESWIRQTKESGLWILTTKAFTVGAQVPDTQRIREMALLALSDLQNYTKENVHLTVPEGRDMVLIERLDSAHQVRVFLPIGGARPMHATANGIAYLAFQPLTVAEKYIAAGLAPSTRQTITDPDTFRALLEQVRQQGYVVNEQGLEDGTTAIAAPIVGPDQQSIAALSISAPSIRLTPDLYIDYGQRALQASKEISSGRLSTTGWN